MPADLIIRITNLPPYTGEYPLDLGMLDMGDYHIIKETAGYTSQEWRDGLMRGDSDLVVAFAIIALRKKGMRVSADAFWNVPLESDAPGMPRIEFIPVVEEGADAGPPPPQTSDSETTSMRSGEPGPSASAHSPASHLRPIGSQDSDTGATSDPLTSAI